MEVVQQTVEAPAQRLPLATRRLAWAIWLLAVAQVLFGLALAWLNQLTPLRLVVEYLVAQTFASLGFATVGLILATRRPHHRIGWLFCLLGLGYGLTCWLGGYTRYTIVTSPGALPAGKLAAWCYLWVWVPIILLATVGLPLLFPDGRLPSSRWRPLAWLAVCAALLLAFSLAISPGPLDAALPELRNPFVPSWSKPVWRATEPVAQLLVLASMLGAVAAQVVRFRRARDVERAQIKWFACASALLVAAFLVPVLSTYPDFKSDTLLSGVMLAIAYPLLAAAVGVAVLRYRLYDIDLLLNRALVYGVLTACIAGIYVLVVGVVGALLQTGERLPLSLLAAGLVAVLFQPMRVRLQRGVDRLLYGERDDPYGVLRRLGQRLRLAYEPGEVLPSLVGTVRDALKLPYVAVALRSGEEFVVVAAEGTQRGEALVLPLNYQREQIGELRVCPRSPGEGWAAIDRRLLADLADHAGVAAHGVRLMAELQRAREQLVLAREEERRRLRNDLHDGLGPSLAALGLTAATVGELIPRNPDAARAVVAELQRAIRTSVADVRRLVYNLRPPTLDELGLVEAIREQAARLNGESTAGVADEHPLQVRLEVAGPLPPLPAAVEVAAFRLAQEALTNVVRHARARSCLIRLACPAGRALALEVEDDGVGLPAERRQGVGLISMQERTAELGGTCTVEGLSRGGTRVSAWLPLPGGASPTEEGSDAFAPRADR